MKTLILEAMHGASKAGRAGLILLIVIVILAIVSSCIAMMLWYIVDIKRTVRHGCIGLASKLEAAAVRLEKRLTDREDTADFTTIADWADYKKWRESQVPTVADIIGDVLRGSVR